MAGTSFALGDVGTRSTVVGADGWRLASGPKFLDTWLENQKANYCHFWPKPWFSSGTRASTPMNSDSLSRTTAAWPAYRLVPIEPATDGAIRSFIASDTWWKTSFTASSIGAASRPATRNSPQPSSLSQHSRPQSITSDANKSTRPNTDFTDDHARLKQFIDAAGDESISKHQLIEVLSNKKCDYKVTLVEGNIMMTVPSFTQNHPELKIALLHLDVDIYEPSKCVIKELYPKLSLGGILILDDYGIFPGATKAVDDYLKDKQERVQRLPYAFAPCYIIKK